MIAGVRSQHTTEAHPSPLPVTFDHAAALAGELADLMRRTGDPHLAKLSTDALAVTALTHTAPELLAPIAGVTEARTRAPWHPGSTGSRSTRTVFRAS